MSDDIIELSVEETNKLRAELGLAPLRGVARSSAADPSSSEDLELSVDATNELRAKLGLKALKVSDGKQSGKSANEALHKPAENDADTIEVQARFERAKLERDVQKHIQEKYSGVGLGEEGSDALSWAAKMRLAKKVTKVKGNKNNERKAASSVPDEVTKVDYSENELNGMNVSHAMSDFEAGSTTILTLADSTLLKRKENSHVVIGLKDTGNELENVELCNAQQQKDGLRQKRHIELGMGKAGGYAGYDDDEFEELGGASGPSKESRVGGAVQEILSTNYRGFKIGQADQEDTSKNDLFSFLRGKAVSLEPCAQDMLASDFLTATEYEATLATKKKKKDSAFKKKSKMPKKERKKNRPLLENEDSDYDDDKKPNFVKPLSKGFITELEETAMEQRLPSKRRRRNDDDEDDEQALIQPDDSKKRSRYDKVMEKGNARTAVAFKIEVRKPVIPFADDEEPDDAFLQAALAKARRLRKLKEMTIPVMKGADAVAHALQTANNTEKPEVISSGVTFAVDDTREFTRALRAREEQAERQKAKKLVKDAVDVVIKEEPPGVNFERTEDISKDEDENIEELAKKIKNDEISFEGTIASVVPVGRGLSNVLSMLKHTGEIAGNKAKEEMRGRAKDKRTYDDYENLDLKKVVLIGSRATEKDIEFANREIKLDYRDEHGRLLTRKEAYRNLCYQFHGHGSNKKNQERKLRQVEREQAEARLASRQVGEGKAGSGSLGALKATQRATGKAFVVHKT